MHINVRSLEGNSILKFLDEVCEAITIRIKRNIATSIPNKRKKVQSYGISSIFAKNFDKYKTPFNSGIFPFERRETSLNSGVFYIYIKTQWPFFCWRPEKRSEFAEQWPFFEDHLASCRNYRVCSTIKYRVKYGTIYLMKLRITMVIYQLSKKSTKSTWSHKWYDFCKDKKIYVFFFCSTFPSTICNLIQNFVAYKINSVKLT